MKEIAIIDYDCGNIYSLSNALKHIEQPHKLVSNPLELKYYDHAILPGVGAFRTAIEHLRAVGFENELHEFVSKGKSVFGICLGMQLLLTKGFENGEFDGLDLIKGSVKKIIPAIDTVRVPHIGYAKIEANPISKASPPLFDETNKEDNYYFVHSFSVVEEEPEDVIGRCDFGGTKITVAVQKQNIAGVQFHPEKSGEDGLNLLRRIQKIFWNEQRSIS